MENTNKKNKTSNKADSVRATETQNKTFCMVELELRRSIVGEITKRMALISFKGLEIIDTIIEKELTKYNITRVQK